MADLLEPVQIIDDRDAAKDAAILQLRFMDDDGCALGFQPADDPLYRALTEVIGIALHRQPVDPDDDFPLPAGIRLPM